MINSYRKHGRGYGECLELRRVLALLVADWDSDGDVDVVNRVGWHENVDGFGNFSSHPFDKQIQTPMATGDLDGDGDLDVSGATHWYANLDGRGSFSSARPIPTLPAVMPETLRLQDVGGDGDLDLVFRAGARGYVVENLDGRGNFGFGHEMTLTGVLDVADVNQDGLLDGLKLEGGDWQHEAVVYLGKVDGSFERVVWWKDPEPDPLFPYYTEQTFELRFGDANADGWIDLLRKSGADGATWGSIHLYLPEEGTLASPLQATSCFNCQVEFADIDQDGDIDGVGDESGRFTLRENIDGSFHLRQVLNNSALRHPDTATAYADMNGDSLIDLVADNLPWMDGATEELHVPGETFATYSPTERRYLPVLPDIAVRSSTVESGDLNGNGRMEIIVTTTETIVAYEDNVPILELTPDVNRSIQRVELVDVDSDGKSDIVVLASRQLHWLKNEGNGQFTLRNMPAIDRARDYSLRDLDQDGLLDLVSYSREAGALGGSEISLAWNQGLSYRYERLDYSGDTILAMEVYDHDGDSDLDLYLMTGKRENGENSYRHVLLENLGTHFGPQQTLVAPTDTIGASVFTIDYNGDQRADLLFDSEHSNSYWRDGKTGEFQTLSVPGNILSVADVDGDGRLDLVSLAGARLYYGRGRIAEPIGEPRLLLTQPEITDLAIEDVTGDGKPDIIAALTPFQTVRRFESRVVGDSNGDGRFDSADLVEIMQAGQYEDTFFRNSDYASGDWNGDREFNANDLIFAMQAGFFETDKLRKGELGI